MVQLPPPLMRTPRSVDIEVTSRCNLRCSYCYFFNNPEVHYDELSTNQWLIFFAELARAAVMDVCLVGGEPFCRQDLPELIGGIVKNRMRFSILSNGTLIDDSIAAFIRDTDRCDHIQVSIDGSCAEIHDSCRGKGAFDKAVNGIRTLQKYDIPVTVRTTLHRKNIDDLDNIARFLLVKLKLNSFTTNAAGYLGTCRDNPEVMLSTTERIKAMKALLRLSEQYPGRISAQAGPHAEAMLWQSMTDAADQNAPPSEKGGRLTGCGCPWSSVTVRSDGAIVPCTMLSHIKLGQINHDSFVDVWQNSTGLDTLRKRRCIPLSSFDWCRDCRYTPYCTGNCPALAYTHTGLVNHPSPDACLRKFLDDGGMLPHKKMNTPVKG